MGNVYEFLYAGRRAPRHGCGSIPSCSSEHQCCNGRRGFYHSAHVRSRVFKKEIFLVCKTHWIGRKGHGDRALCWIKVFANNYKQKCMSLRMLFFVLAENASPFQQWEKLVNMREFHISSHLRHIVNFMTSLESRSCSIGNDH